MATMPEPEKRITIEELVSIITALVHQLGGSAYIDSAEYMRISEQKRTVSIQTQVDPWGMIIKEVDN